MPACDQIFVNNRLWLENSLAKDPKFLERLQQDQHPDYLCIGRSDSRVTAEDLMGFKPVKHSSIATSPTLSKASTSQRRAW